MRIRALLAVMVVGCLVVVPTGGPAAALGSSDGAGNARGAAASSPQGAPASQQHEQQTMDLMAFNGYYALDVSPGAFFYVNTTMSATKGGAVQEYAISLDVSLDGTTSLSTPFTGTFRGGRLVQKAPGGPSFDLRLTRTSRSLGPTASVAGTITLPGQKPAKVSGTTYSNPTPASFWAGETYFAPAATSGGKPTAAVRMTEDGGIYYKKGSSPAWVRAESYTYNLDMYYFALTDRDLIMGTAGQSGKVANEMMTMASGVVTQRDLITMPNAVAPTTGAANWYPPFGDGAQLGDFSGYYPIGTKRHPEAFVSIEGVSLADPSLSAEELSRVLISVSTDGKTVRSWYYDVLAGMSFDGRVLTMPTQGITLRLQRKYDRRTGTLFTLKGTIGERRISGQSSFNSIPLPAFAGTLRDKAGQHVLVITSEGDVTLDGQSIPNYQYVPTMYILAGPIPGTTPVSQPVTLLSLGFSGASGRTAIVTTNFGTAQAQTFTAYAIPNP